MNLTRLAPVCGLLTVIAAAISPASYGTTISLGLEDPFTAAKFAPGAQTDFWQAVNDPSDISSLLPSITDVEIGSDFFKYAPVSDVQSLLKWTAASGVGLELQTGVLPVTTSSGCGWGVEGYDGLFEQHLQLIKSLGGTVAVLNMDEPLYFGSNAAGTNTCQSPIATIAAETVASIEIAKSIFPDIKVIDTEPVPFTTSYGTWLADINTLMPGAISEFDADVVWSSNWSGPLKQDYSMAEQYGVQTGVIIDSDSSNKTDCSWTNAAENNFNSLSQDGLVPSNILVQSWDSVPTRIGPPSEPCTLSSVASYVIAQSQTQKITDPPFPVPEPPESLVLLTMGLAVACLGRLRRGQRPEGRR
jgi:hypothetical protein